MKVLIVGAGVTGCFTASRLHKKGVNVSLLARGDRANLLEQAGLQTRDAITQQSETIPLNIVRAPVTETFDVAIVCVQATQRTSLTSLLSEVPGRPTVWYLGNTTQGFDEATEQLGSDRVLGGFPGVGGTWDGEVLVYADREKPGDKPFDRLIIGESNSDASAAADAVQNHLRQKGMSIERYVPIMAWHWSHIGLILPLAAALYHRDLNLEAVVADRALRKRVMRTTAQSFHAIRRAGYPVLPRSLNLMRWTPLGLGAWKVAKLLQSDFGRIALAAHAATARDEMRGFAKDFLELAGTNAGADLQETLGWI